MSPVPNSPHFRPGPAAIIAAVAAGLGLYVLAPRPPPARPPPSHPAARSAGSRRPAAAAVQPATPVAPIDRSAVAPVDRLLTAPDAEARERLFRDVVAQGNAALPALQAALRSASSAEPVESLFRALAAIGTVESMGLFMEYLNDEAHHAQRERLAPHLAFLESRASAEQVLDWLIASTNYDITLASIDCLQRLADASLIAGLQERYGDPERSDFQKQQLRAVVKGLRDPGTVPRLADMLKPDTDPDLREAAAAGLAHMGTQEAVDVLLERIDAAGDGPADSFLLTALGSVSNKEVRSHLTTCFDAATDPKVKYALGCALAR